MRFTPHRELILFSLVLRLFRNVLLLFPGCCRPPYYKPNNIGNNESFLHFSEFSLQKFFHVENWLGLVTCQGTERFSWFGVDMEPENSIYCAIHISSSNRRCNSSQRAARFWSHYSISNIIIANIHLTGCVAAGAGAQDAAVLSCSHCWTKKYFHSLFAKYKGTSNKSSIVKYEYIWKSLINSLEMLANHVI